MNLVCKSLLLLLLAILPLHAFPPAPYYTLYGTVRDQVNPHFPALRSDPMALSGASRRKQTGSVSTNLLKVS